MYDTLNIKTYTRKELTRWVETECKYKFQQLRNGVFFCKIISILLKEPLKYNPEPKTEHQFTLNLNLAKKALHKHSLPFFFDVQNILSSKNHFTIANWFRNLFDGNIKEGVIAVDSIQEGKPKEPPQQTRTSFSGVPLPISRPPPRPTLQLQPYESVPNFNPVSPRAKPMKTNNFPQVKIMTPKRPSLQNASLLRKSIRKSISRSRERDDRRSSLKSNSKSRLELVKRESGPRSPSSVKKRETIPSIAAFTEGQEDEQVLMQQMAVQQVIAGLENILQRVREAVANADLHETLQLYSQAIHVAIFSRQIPYI